MNLRPFLVKPYGADERARRDATLYRLVCNGTVAAEYLPNVDNDYQEVIADNPFFRDLTIPDTATPVVKASSRVKEKPLVDAIEDLEEEKGLLSKKEHQQKREERKHAFSYLEGLKRPWPYKLQQVEKLAQRGSQVESRPGSILLMFILLLLAVGLGTLTVYFYRHSGTPSASVTAIINIITVVVALALLAAIHGIFGLIVGVIVAVALNLLLTKVFIGFLHLDERLYLVFFALTVLMLLFALLALWNVIRLASVKPLSEEEDETLFLTSRQCARVSALLTAYVEIFHWSDPWLQAQIKDFQERYGAVEKLLMPDQKG